MEESHHYNAQTTKGYERSLESMTCLPINFVEFDNRYGTWLDRNTPGKRTLEENKVLLGHEGIGYSPKSHMKDRMKKICILKSQTICIISRLAGVGISSVIETNVFGTKSRHLSFLDSVT